MHPYSIKFFFTLLPLSYSFLLPSAISKLRHVRPALSVSRFGFKGANVCDLLMWGAVYRYPAL